MSRNLPTVVRNTTAPRTWWTKDTPNTHAAATARNTPPRTALP
ncbi:hypothetical protein ABZY03_15650 [Streptomyces klenkii]